MDRRKTETSLELAEVPGLDPFGRTSRTFVWKVGLGVGALVGSIDLRRYDWSPRDMVVDPKVLVDDDMTT